MNSIGLGTSINWLGKELELEIDKQTEVKSRTTQNDDLEFVTFV